MSRKRAFLDRFEEQIIRDAALTERRRKMPKLSDEERVKELTTLTGEAKRWIRTSATEVSSFSSFSSPLSLPSPSQFSSPTQYPLSLLRILQ